LLIGTVLTQMTVSIECVSVISDAARRYSRLRNRTERGRVELAQIHNLLLHLYLHLKAGNYKDLARLVDVLKLHGFLPSFDAR